MTIEQRVIKIISDDLMLKDDSVTLESHLVNDLAVGSLDVVYTLMNLEQEFKIIFDESAHATVNTVQDVVNLVAELIKK